MSWLSNLSVAAGKVGGGSWMNLHLIPYGQYPSALYVLHGCTHIQSLWYEIYKSACMCANHCDAHAGAHALKRCMPNAALYVVWVVGTLMKAR